MEEVMARWKTLGELEKELLKDKDFRKEFASLEPEYQIARTILSARQAIGMSQQSLAKAIGTSQSRISLWERAEETPRWDTLKKIANATGVTFHIGIEPSGNRVSKRNAAQSDPVRKAARKATASRTTTGKAARKKSAGRKRSTGRRRGA